jgi:hypothetical protein
LENIVGKRVIGHTGGDLGVSSALEWFPDSGNYTVVALSNYDRGGIITIDKLQEMNCSKSKIKSKSFPLSLPPLQDIRTVLK